MNPNYNEKAQNGFVLTELLVYIAIFAASATFLTAIFTTVTRIHIRQNSVNEVNNQASFVLDTIRRVVQESSLIDINPSIATSTLTLRMSSSTLDRTLVYTDDSFLYLKEGNGLPITLTNSKVSVDDFSVVKLENPGGKAIVQIDLSLTSTARNQKTAFSRTLRTVIARVSAATFDDHLIPNTGNAHDLGNAVNAWRDGYFSGNIGIGTSPPTSGTRVKSAGDIGFTNSSSGIIFRTPNNSCYRLTMNNSAQFTTSTIACP